MIEQRIIQDVCMEFGVDRDELEGHSRKRGTIGIARSAVVRRLKEAGLSVFQMAATLNSDGATIAFYLYEGAQKVHRPYARSRA